MAQIVAVADKLPRPWTDRVLALRDRLLASSRFRYWASAFPVTRPIARRRARELFDLCAGFVYSQVLLACVRLNLFEILSAGPLTVAELAPRLSLSEDTTARLLRAAASLRLLERRGPERYGLGPLGAAMIGNPGIAAMVEHHALLYADLRDPVALLRGERSKTELGRYWAYAGRSVDPSAAQVAAYTELMAASQPLVAAEVLDAYRFDRHRCLLDAGGGNGAFLSAVASRYSELRMKTVAVVLEQPEHLALSQLDLTPPGEDDLVVDIEWSGISTGTERLLWSGRMPDFPGMGYPLVPGYESIGRIRSVGNGSRHRVGDRVFVPGARCFGEVRGLFGGAASRLVVPEHRALPIDEQLGEQGVLLALAATAYHAIYQATLGDFMVPDFPDLIVGHGVLGRFLARLALQVGGAPPTVWERNPRRTRGADGYRVIDPDDDPRRDYRAIYDVSGDGSLLDSLIGRLAKGGEIVLAGFYSEPLSFTFPPAFMREARIRVAAEWQASDLLAVNELAEQGRLSLDGLITHRREAVQADQAYRTAFGDSDCLKMILDWRTCQ